MIGLAPQVTNASPITDKATWTKISGVFSATGGEEWLTIGYFPPDGVEIGMVPVDGGEYPWPYYFLDSVMVYPADIVSDQDSDGDGLLDTTEIELALAHGYGCPSLFDPDSDDDGLSDGLKVNVTHSDPCEADTDGEFLILKMMIL